MSNKVNIYLSYEAYHKMGLYTEIAKGEISGLGEVHRYNNEKTGDTELWVSDVYIFDQVCSEGHTEIDKKALAKFYDDVQKNNGSTDNLKLWWHSHASGAVFWSGTDTSTIEDYDNETDIDNWLLSIVTNKDGDFKCRVDIFRPVRMTLDDIPVIVISHPTDMRKSIADEVKEKVKEYEPPKRNAYTIWKKTEKKKKVLYYGYNDTKIWDQDSKVFLFKDDYFEKYPEQKGWAKASGWNDEMTDEEEEETWTQFADREYEAYEKQKLLDGEVEE